MGLDDLFVDPTGSFACPDTGGANETVAGATFFTIPQDGYGTVQLLFLCVTRVGSREPASPRACCRRAGRRGAHACARRQREPGARATPTSR
jgi:hypothetical protein